jgi:hypothetical protein
MANTNSLPQRRRRGPSIEVVDAKVAVDLATAQTYSENVFLFVPNLIGWLWFQMGCTHSQAIRRIRPHHFSWSFATLHELSPKVLHDCLCDFVSPGCS